MKVQLNPEAWNVDALETVDGVRLEKGKPVEVSKKQFDSYADLKIDHFGKQISAVVVVTEVDAEEEVVVEDPTNKEVVR